MSTGTGTTMLCAHCGRPMLTWVWIGGVGYHEECTRGMMAGLLPPLTEERVRQIVREEMARASPYPAPSE